MRICCWEIPQGLGGRALLDEPAVAPHDGRCWLGHRCRVSSVGCSGARVPLLACRAVFSWPTACSPMHPMSVRSISILMDDFSLRVAARPKRQSTAGRARSGTRRKDFVQAVGDKKHWRSQWQEPEVSLLLQFLRTASFYFQRWLYDERPHNHQYCDNNVNSHPCNTIKSERCDRIE